MKVSVIIPTYNRVSTLVRAIDSVLNQTYQNWELIVVDDGSTDDTADLVRSYQAHDTRISYTYQENKGQGAARNAGLQMAKGAYVAFLDSDDEWLPEKLAKQLALFEHSSVPDLGFVGCCIEDVNEQTGHRRQSRGYHTGDVLLGVLEWKLTHDYIHTSSVLIKREVITEVGGFDESLMLHQDLDLWLRIARLYQFDMVDEVLVRYHIAGDNVSKTADFAKRAEQKRRFLEKNHDVYKQFPKAYTIKIREVALYYMYSTDGARSRIWFKRAQKYASFPLVYLVASWMAPLGAWVHRFSLGHSLRAMVRKVKRRLFN